MLYSQFHLFTPLVSARTGAPIVGRVRPIDYGREMEFDFLTEWYTLLLLEAQYDEYVKIRQQSCFKEFSRG